MRTNTTQGERFLRLPEVRQRVSVARSTIWHWIRLGQFPAPIRLGPNTSAWRESEIEAWIAARIASGRGSP